MSRLPEENICRIRNTIAFALLGGGQLSPKAIKHGFSNHSAAFLEGMPYL
jgi:hypothetical protein